MRTLKFRAWDGTKMWEPEFLEDLWTGNRYETKRDLPRYPSCQIMQFTGLHDKTGKEIWEGDVVELASGSGIRVIRWYDGSFWVEVNDYQKGRPTFPIHFLSYDETDRLPKVLGNIYEQPELVKG